MGFLDSKQSRKRKRKEPTKDKSKPPRTKIELISVADKYPPDTKEQILIWEAVWGYSIYPAHIVLDHIKDDKRTLGYSRFRYWAKLED